jgi:Flp pilus assembly protein TadD
MHIYLPRTSRSNDEFIMASHADRFALSKCYIAGKGKFVCTTCHNPHISVRKTNPEHFNNTCRSCHPSSLPNHGCTKSFSAAEAKNLNCVGCHMPSSGSTDIPHVSVHDHYIRKPKAKQANEPASTEAFLGLAAINTNKPSHRSRINAYLQQFERFEPRPYYLDSAFALLKNQPITAYRYEWVLYYFLADNPSGIVKAVEENGKTEAWMAALAAKSWDNKNAWTAYRISEAYRKFSDYSKALVFMNHAIALAPYIPQFYVKQGNLLVLNEQFALAEKAYRKAISENKNEAEAFSGLSYALLAQERIAEAEKAAKQCLRLNPDYEQGQVNLASIYLAQSRWREARALLMRIVKNNPNNKRAQAALDFLQKEGLGL